MLPNAGLGDAREREQMIENYKKGNTSLKDVHYRFDIVDEANGFLSVTGAMEGKWEMCYWNLPDNKRLIAVYFQGCGPVCYIEEFQFFHFDGNKKTFTPVDREIIIPGYKSIYDNFLLKDLTETRAQLKKDDVIATLLFRIPRKGKEIIAMFGNEESAGVYAKYAKGNRMTLTWDNGTFKKGKIYWEK